MTTKSKNILFGLVACIVAVVVLLGMMDYFSFARTLDSITAGIQEGMELREAEAILKSRTFIKTKGQASDGDKFAFRQSALDIDSKTNFFVGSVEGKVFMVRVEHQDDIVKYILAEKMRFEKGG